MKFYQRLLSSAVILLFIFLIYHRFHFIRKLTNPKLVINSSKTDTEPVRIFTNSNPKCNRTNFLNRNIANVFQPIDFSETLAKGYIYSAYLDNRGSSKIIVISLLERFSSDLFCIIWFSSFSATTVKAEIRSIPEGLDRRFTASYIACPLGNTPKAPLHVSIIENECALIPNILKITAIHKTPTSRNFSVCVTPFNLNYNNVDQLLEMISINRIFGASHIFFYNYSTGAKVDIVLHAFSRRSFVTVLPWSLPMKVHRWPLPPNYEEEVKYFAQMAMLNDCLYRNMGRFKYVAFADLDEYLWPRRHSDWHALFDEVGKDSADRAATKAWVFRNIFFKTEWPSATDLSANRTVAALHAMSLVKVRREATVYQQGQRSKLIVEPRAVDMMGVHNVWQFREGGATVLAPEDGLCHHYRFWDGMGEREFVEDRNALRMREPLVRELQTNRRLFGL